MVSGIAAHNIGQGFRERESVPPSVARSGIDELFSRSVSIAELGKERETLPM